MQNDWLRWLPSLPDLSEEQRRVINSDFNGRTIVYGPAGCGKSVVTIYRAKTLFDQRRDFKVLVFTRMLVRFLEAAVNRLGLPADSVQSFYSWVYQTHWRLIGRPPKLQDEDEMYAKWTDALIDRFSRDPASNPRYEYVLVDEAQDFRPNASTLLKMVSRNLFVAGDTAQSIYEPISSLHELAQLWAPTGDQIQLLSNYRNPRRVAEVAGTFCEDPYFLGRTVGRSQENKPRLYWVDSPANRVERIAQIIQESRGGVRIGVLYRHRTSLHADSRELRRMNVLHQVATPGKAKEVDFNTPQPVLITVHSAKGLEFDWVIMPDLTAQAWSGPAQDQQERHLFFVGLTRTKDRLYLLSERGSECDYLKWILAEDERRRNAGLPVLVEVPADTKFDEPEPPGDDLPF
ncbi:MAG: 3'-5' exonuclease [Chloroflexota bacterium]